MGYSLNVCSYHVALALACLHPPSVRCVKCYVIFPVGIHTIRPSACQLQGPPISTWFCSRFPPVKVICPKEVDQMTIFLLCSQLQLEFNIKSCSGIPGYPPEHSTVREKTSFPTSIVGVTETIVAFSCYCGCDVCGNQL